jgi:hypothetical protein
MKHMIHAIDDSSISSAENRARELFAKILSTYQSHAHGSLWIFGHAIGPTISDGHVVPFIARLRDVQRASLVPGQLLEYASVIMRLDEWNGVTHGRPTMWNVSIGHVHLLESI